MLYHVATYNDGTEVTASKPNTKGEVKLYIERFDVTKDAFVSAMILIPGAAVIENNGLDSEELNRYVKLYSSIESDIIQYVSEKVKNIA